MQQTEQAFDIKCYWSAILRRKYIALSVGLSVLSLFTWGSFLMPKTYEASSTVSIEQDSVLEPLLKGVSVSSSKDDRLKNLKSEITSRNILEKTIKKLGIDTDAKNPEQYNSLLQKLRESLYLRVKGDTPNFFYISYRDDDPKRVADIVNTITKTYIEEHMQSRRMDVSEAYDFIQSQLLEYKNKLESSDKTIREFRERNPNMVPQNENTILGRLESFQGSKIETDIKMKELIRKKENLQNQLSGEKELTVAIVTREGSPQARLSYLNNQLMLLTAKYTENYPEVIKVKAEIEELKKQIAQAKDLRMEGGSETATLNPVYQQLREELARTEAEIESLKARSMELSNQQQKVQKILGRMPKEQEEWTKLQRDRTVFQQIYDQLLQKLENARVSKDLEIGEKGETFRLVDPAIIPLAPVKPDRIKMILLGIFLGIVSGIGTVLGLEYFDHSFKNENSIEASLKLPVLATIPEITTEVDDLSAKQFQRKVFRAVGIYLLVIGLVLLEEIIARYMGINIINF